MIDSSHEPLVALITGASSGLGREFARIHAARGGSLVIVARNRDALEEVRTELESRHGVRALVVDCDLSDPGATRRIVEEIKTAGMSIDILINNAGFGGRGFFHERSAEDDAGMIAVNCVAPTALLHAFLPGMIARGAGRVLNVASTAGMLPGPLQAVYYASKAYVLSLSEALAEELRDTGVTVTALCPGPVDTGFAKRAHTERTRLFHQSQSPERVARIGYEAMLKGTLRVSNDRWLWLQLRWLVPLLPRRMVLRLSRRAMENTS